MTQFNFKAIGTTWQIDIYKELDSQKEEELLLIIKNRIEVFESNYSRFREDSIVTKISKQVGEYGLPEDAEKMMSIYHELYNLTNGFFSPFMGNLLSDAGYDSNYSLQPKDELSVPPEWNDVFEYSHPKLTVKKSVMLDFGAAGKGYIVDIIGELLNSEGVDEYCIDAGGDILHKGKNTIRVGLENPKNLDQVIGVCTLQNGSICGSSGNRRSWGKYNHIMNPKTLESSDEIIAIWVTAKTAMIADALATCLFFVDASMLAPLYDFEYVLIRKDFSMEKSEGFQGEFF
ncbi:MAG: FAD:protein FMN transferase [bacterium]